MNIIKKIISFVKNIFTKQDEVQKIEETKRIANEDKKIDFIESLKITNTEEKTNKIVETLICNGDGLGIKKKITY